jgi:alpha-tubulin suppressor-like RCC1 family protein
VAGVTAPTDATFVVDATTGAVFCTGLNSTGWFGRGNTTASTSWVQATSFTGVAARVIANHHTRLTAFIHDMSDHIWVAGDNAYGQLGLGSGNQTNQNNFTDLSLVQAPFQGTVKEVHLSGANYGTNFVVTTDGELWSSGQNAYGQRGLGHQIDTAWERSTWKRVGLKALVVTARNTAYDDASSILVLADNGRLYTCGHEAALTEPSGHWSSALMSIT